MDNGVMGMDDDASRGLQKKRRWVFVLRNVVVSLDLEEMSGCSVKERKKKAVVGRVKESGCVDGGEHKGKERRERFGGARP